MAGNYKSLEKSLPKVHKFGWTPSFEKSLQTSHNPEILSEIAAQTVEKLEWVLFFKDEEVLKAVRKNRFNTHTEEISIHIRNGEITVKSHSIGNEIWDNGRNSRRVQLFLHVFQELISSFSPSELKELEKEIIKDANWENYQIPEMLPTQPLPKGNKFWILVLGAIGLSLVIGFIFGFLVQNDLYIIPLFEILIGIGIGKTFIWIMKLIDEDRFDQVLLVLIGSTLLTYMVYLFTRYSISMMADGLTYSDLSFLEYLELLLNYGLGIFPESLAWVEGILLWLIHIVFIGIIAYFTLSLSYNSFIIGRVPRDVWEYTLYLYAQQKSEEQIRSSLAEKGWDTRENQDKVFMAIQVIYASREATKQAK